MYRFSARENSFYHPSINYTTLPDDIIDVTDEVFQEFALNEPPSGKVRGAWKSGNPRWVDIPEPTQEEITASNDYAKSKLIAEVEALISPLKYAAELEIATDEESARLATLKSFVVEVNRIDTTGEVVSWPTIP